MDTKHYSSFASLSTICGFLSLAMTFFTPGVCLADRSSPSFLATWKLLSNQERQHFIAGYVQGWKDAAKVTDIAISFVRTNPEQAIEGLEGVKQLYDLQGVQSSRLVREIDLYYSDPENGAAPLSRAVTSARKRIIEQPREN